MGGAVIDPARIRALLIDLDGVLTDSARLHAAAWKAAFDPALAAAESGDRRAFDAVHDYRAHVDGRPRLDGARAFLAARGVPIAEGGPDDPPGTDTLHAVAAAKNAAFLERLRREGAPLRAGAGDFMGRARGAGLRLALVTASRNGAEVARAAGLEEAFDARVDGQTAARLKLDGKPAPDSFLEAARRLGVAAERAAVLEDSEAGIRAARAGGFAQAVALAPPAREAAMRRAGADAVAEALEEVTFAEPDVPGDRLALDHLDEISARLDGRPPAVFLDYDGTLTPIAARPDLATLSEPMREDLAALALRAPVCIISGRGLDELERLVGLDGPVYAGAHGFDIRGPEGSGLRARRAAEHVPALHAAAEALREDLADVPGVIVEDKGQAVAVHYRQAPEAARARIDTAVQAACERAGSLRRTGGKMVHELRPDIPWDKGRAVLWLLERMETGEAVPVYVGDDETDRDAFRALAGRGVSVLVSETPQPEAGADYRLRDPGETRRLLEALARLAEGAPA